MRRLRIQLRLRGVGEERLRDLDEEFESAIPFFPPINEKTIKAYTRFYAVTVIGIIVFGGLVAPMLEVRLGVGGAWRGLLRLCVGACAAGGVDPPPSKLALCRL